MPVDLSDFLNDDRVAAISKKDEAGVDIGYEGPEDFPPEWDAEGAAGSGTAASPLIKSGSAGIKITVANADDYDEVEWYYGDEALGRGKTFTVDTAKPPFDAEGVYQIAVVGTKDGLSYSAEIYIKIE